MDAIKSLLNEKKIDEDVKRLFPSMETENTDDMAIIEDFVDLETATPNNLAEIKNMFDNLNREECKKLGDKQEIKNLKLACTRCLTFDFDKLDAPPKYDDYKRMFYIKSERIINTKLKEGRNEKIIKGTNHFFKCECCGARNCIAIEEETN